VRLGIDACSWSNRRGFGRFTRELLGHMVAEAGAHELTLIVDRATADQWDLPRGARLDVVATTAQPSRAASARGARTPADLWRLARAAGRHAFDVFFFPAVYSFYPLLRRVPSVITFHDAIADDHGDLVFPGPWPRLLWGAKSWMARRQADRILTVSESAKDDIVRRFGDAARVRVIGEAAGSQFHVSGDRDGPRRVRAAYGLPAEGPLLLHVGGLSPHKNLSRLLLALETLARPEHPWHLALVGNDTADGFHSEVDALRQILQQAPLRGRVTLTGEVPDRDLVLLYNAATALVMPSLAEGFGLPAVEAMACGLPVAASRRGSLPEVLGSAAVYFDPSSATEMTSAVLAVLTDGALRERLRQEGLQRARTFSWRAAARATFGVCEELAHA
jgi:glycosyltransferase involved in cell wall biosynthesis